MQSVVPDSPAAACGMVAGTIPRGAVSNVCAHELQVPLFAKYTERFCPATAAPLPFLMPSNEVWKEARHLLQASLSLSYTRTAPFPFHVPAKTLAAIRAVIAGSPRALMRWDCPAAEMLHLLVLQEPLVMRMVILARSTSEMWK